MEAWRHGDVETWRHGDIKRKTEMEPQVIFLILLTVGSLCKRKFVVCPFVDEETNGSYPLENGLAHLGISLECSCMGKRCGSRRPIS
jgi:hypothetical protein